MPDNPRFDVMDFANAAAGQLESINQVMQSIGKTLHEIKAGQEKNIHKQHKMITPGTDVSFNFLVMSIYVDNSQGANAISLTDENGVTYTVAANLQQWVHPLGSRMFQVSGDAACPGMFVDTFLPIK